MLVLALGGLYSNTLQAQRTYNNGNAFDFIYQSAASILEDNVHGVTPGYGFAYTNSGVSPVRPEFIRTDFDGAPLNRLYYPENNGNDSRFTHIEEISNQFLAPDKQFLVVGSIENASGSLLTVALLDEMGNITSQNHFRSEEMEHLMGIKGIYNEFSDQFCIVGIQAAGFSTTDEKDIIVLGLDNALNLIWEVKLSSPYLIDDHDFVTDVVLIGPHEYAIVGTCNDQNPLASQPATMTAIVDPGSVFSFNAKHLNFPGAYDNAAAVARPEPMGSDLWIMSNSYAFSGFLNAIILKQTDYVGNIFATHQILTGTDRYLGFNLEILSGDLLGISGYKYTSSNEAIPFYMRFDPATATIVDQYEYPNFISNAGITTYNENNLLRMLAIQSTMPYYYNEISAIRADYSGVVFTANDDSFSPGYGLRAYGISESGTYSTSSCGALVATSYAVSNTSTTSMPDLIFNNAFVSEEGAFMSQTNLAIIDDVCGPLYKTNNLSDETDLDVNTRSIYPNPSESEFNINGYTHATSIVVYDMVGRLILEKAIDKNESSIVLKGAKNGTYLVKIMNGDRVIATERIQVNK